MLSRPTIDGAMYGVLTTLQSGRGSQLIPVATAIALVPIRGGAPVPTGRIVRTDPHYARCREHLDRVKADGFAILM